MSELGILFFGTAAGFTVAGLFATGYRLITGETLSFALSGNDASIAFLGILLRMVAAPVLLVRFTMNEIEEGAVRPGLCLAAMTLACVWGFLSGVIVIETIAGFGGAANPAATVATGYLFGR
jgi:hypothetical protein